MAFEYQGNGVLLECFGREHYNSDMRVWFSTFILLLLVDCQVALAAEVTPPKGTDQPLGGRSKTPSKGAPQIPPSQIDPGIERRPSSVPDPRSAVSPPNVDPKMAVDPETAPPAKEAIKPPKGEEGKGSEPGR